MVRISDIQNNTVLWQNVPFCDIPEAEIETYTLRTNDILFARTGGTVGKSYLVESVPEESVYAGYLIRTRYSLNLCPHYLKFFMESPFYWSQLKEGTTATAQPNCNGKTLSNMLVPIPPIKEQHRVVGELKKVFTFIEKYNEKHIELKELNISFPEHLKKSILQEAVQGKLVPQDPNDEPASVLLERIHAEKERLIAEGKIKRDKHESWIFKRDNSHYELRDGVEVCIDDEIPFEIPESWEWVRVKDIFQITMGQSPDGATVSTSGKGIEFHQGKIFFTDRIIAKSEQITSEPSKIAEANSILLCVRAPVGKVNITDRTLCIGRGLCALKPLGDYSLDFAYFLFEALEKVFISKSTGTTFKAITGEVVKEQLIPLLPSNEQKRIVQKINSLKVITDLI